VTVTRCERVRERAEKHTEPARTRILTVLEKIERGHLDASEALATFVRERRINRWVAFEVALEVAEYRLGGSARLTGPTGVRDSRYAPFTVETFSPEPDRMELYLEEGPMRYSLAGDINRASPELWEAIKLLASELEAALGSVVKIFSIGTKS
jgi:hypothetical protein